MLKMLLSAKKNQGVRNIKKIMKIKRDDNFKAWQNKTNERRHKNSPINSDNENEDNHSKKCQKITKKRKKGPSFEQK